MKVLGSQRPLPNCDQGWSRSPSSHGPSWSHMLVNAPWSPWLGALGRCLEGGSGGGLSGEGWAQVWRVVGENI